jgi:hypothetical protein
MTVTVTLDESERRLVLMALAHLAVERPGFDLTLFKIAQQIDNSRPEMYTEFKELHAAKRIDYTGSWGF